MTFDPVVAPGDLALCGCGASPLWRDVLIERASVRACMACGETQLVSEEWRQPDDPHGDLELVAIRLLTLDPDTKPWLAALPRVVDPVVSMAKHPCYLPAALRVPDETALAAAERAVTALADAPLRERIVRAGIPGPPPRHDLRYETNPYVAVHAALAFTIETPVADVVALTTNPTSLARRLAEEHLETRPGVIAVLATALEDGSIPLLQALPPLTRLSQVGSSGHSARLAATLARLLAGALAHAAERETDIDALVEAIRTLGPGAATCAASLRRLAETDLVRRRSTLRQAVGNALRAIEA